MIDRAYARKRPALLARVDVIPYIDVMLVLVAIFLLTAPFLSPGQLPVPRLSRAQSVPPQVVHISFRDEAHVEVSIGKQHTVYKMSAAIPAVADLVRHSSGKAPLQVLLAASPNQNYGVVMHFLDRLQAAEIPSVGLLVRTEPHS